MSEESSGGERSGLETTAFSGAGFHGEIAVPYRGTDLAADIASTVDIGGAADTIHWGRNYLFGSTFDTGRGRIDVVVKQFRNQGRRAVVDRRWRGSKAERSWRVAGELLAAGLSTPQPIAVVESDREDGPSFFIARRLHGASEVRYFFRRLHGGDTAGDEFPEIAPDRMLSDLGRLARRLHDAGIVYRDLSMGNVLAVPGDEGLDLYLVDFNRARIGQRPGCWRRMRDACRFPIVAPQHQDAFLAGYWGRVPGRLDPRRWVFVASVRGYLLKHAVKNRLRRKRAPGRRPTSHHPHIPPAHAGASARDRSVWDHLSDQPHQHAGRWTKLGVRIADAPGHARDLALAVRAAPRVRRRYHELRRELYRAPFRFDGVGVCVRPHPDDPEGHLEAIAGLGIRSVLLRLHPWQDRHDHEEALARELSDRGFELTFALPQLRELVRDRDRWRRAVAELGSRFRPFGARFQIGQAINRSKWGVWTTNEYVELYRAAAEELRALGDVELLGPAVIDFEYQGMLALLERAVPELRFDIVSSLLYVDRRGAPENPQLGFDTVGKVLLLKAIADAGRNARGRCWITEVNWPLWEGPHSPAGKSVSVDEDSQADYLVRYFLLALGTGCVERVFWWRLVARGYGLAVAESDGRLRLRPAYRAMAALVQLVCGWTFSGPLASPDGTSVYRFERDGRVRLVVWAHGEPRVVDLTDEVVAAWSRDGEQMQPPVGRMRAMPSPVYLELG
jgi:tRNA A-37 threonylcarbamoyl transferase component Bud32